MELNLFTEMQSFAAAQPAVEPELILRTATLNGARALGLPGQIGELAAGALADLIAIRFAGKPSDACAALVHHTGDIAVSMIDGEWAVPPAA